MASRVSFSSVQMFPCRDGVTRLAYSVLGEKSKACPVIMICGLSGVVSEWMQLPHVLAHHRQVG